MSNKNNGNVDVGYGKPPKSGQFQKGQSGNPKGRPRKKKEEPVYHSANYPTREIMRSEALRPVTTREGDRQVDMPTTQAVLRALAIAAIKGGPMAQRTYLDYMKAEDERHHAERQEGFDFWWTYQRKSREEIALAKERGLPEPAVYPHPEDIKLNYTTLDVEFTGPMDAEDQKVYDKRIDLRNYFYELVFYYGEIEKMQDYEPGAAIGFFFSCYSVLNLNLPKRLRGHSKDYEYHLTNLMTGPRKIWEQNLKKRADQFDVPFKRVAKSRLKPQVYLIEQLGFKRVDGFLKPTAETLRKIADNPLDFGVGL